MRRIGIDVGGTNTDAVLIEDDRVVAAVKTVTTDDVTTGILTALDELVNAMGGESGRVHAVMIGTTHFTNAVLQRRDVTSVAAIRIGLPASASLVPFIDWPADLVELVRGEVFLVEGGHEYDGRPIVPFDVRRMRDIALTIRDTGIRSVAVCSVFSPLTAESEEAAADVLQSICPDVDVTLSHQLGRIGLLGRENATLLNACLIELARHTTRSFTDALHNSGIHAPLYLTQNDGTVMRADYAEAFPVYSFASGATNSMRGAAFLSKLNDAMVVDVGGTSTDIGCLKAGFPREANSAVEIGGVRTLFRMPDLVSIGLGGGTIIDPEHDRIGPQSVGNRITRDALVFGGGRLTATDVAVAGGLLQLGDASRVAHLDRRTTSRLRQRMSSMIDASVDRMKTDATAIPLVAVGGGAFLVPERLNGISEVVQVEHHAVANAVGAAIAQVSGEVDHVFSALPRAEAIEQATAAARQRALEAGAEEHSLSVVDVEDLPLAYLPGDARRIRVRVVGDVASSDGSPGIDRGT
ncbi:MAG: hydantoinase/oxoprolinase family protein [Gemmatimonadales bacterium]|nr:hydantoinase/oxoprolinase family protein [Gemmatimonadales bacterium]NIN10847.1 hydantoinase/oxoprolinase family protein [Gemmatimonadales bacterium]NIR02855.1 hydantoinase/oxoprolinase family protein [Gemmatimonadales bacterium]NIS66489.1 hydantoinase/oxoprolinase family protein [Gemmatimonadales bacterium]